jgi:hypothetical protein
VPGGDVHRVFYARKPRKGTEAGFAAGAEGDGMGRGGRWAAGVLVGLAVIVAIAIPFRVQIALGLLGWMVQSRTPVGPNQDVTWASGPDPMGRAPDARPPNVVLILADDLGFNDVTFGGGGVAGGTVPTPHIDSIAEDGVVFTNGYAANGTCAPSRAALMSGRYGTRFGFEFTPTPPGMMQLARFRPNDLSAEDFVRAWLHQHLHPAFHVALGKRPVQIVEPIANHFHRNTLGRGVCFR